MFKDVENTSIRKKISADFILAVELGTKRDPLISKVKKKKAKA